MSIWLPSLSELVGTSGVQHVTYGTFNAAMQGLNISSTTDTDKQGGNQFAYFKQYNASGGGAVLWVTGGSEQGWLRSPNPANTTNVWHITNTIAFHTDAADSTAHAVHPAVGTDEKC